ncbi:hypothetical protein E2C01_097520 [Portunus trituberculatus]|uniref:Uncharacterized protein n=1 Tax=Portunus trituberculatus TaxID=210409 RepID=A0A5B7K9U5_PORTR|nr:hypothetical protein [Portunus trituberculatus]
MLFEGQRRKSEPRRPWQTPQRLVPARPDKSAVMETKTSHGGESTVPAISSVEFVCGRILHPQRPSLRTPLLVPPLTTTLRTPPNPHRHPSAPSRGKEALKTKILKNKSITKLDCDV